MSLRQKVRKGRSIGYRNAVDALRSRVLFRYGFAGERLGFHVLPVHYYSPVPSLTELRANEAWWTRPIDVSAVDLSIDRQAAFLRSLAKVDQADIPPYDVVEAGNPGEGMGPVDAELLYRVVRSHRPSRVIEVGSGTSTVYIARALARNALEGGDGTLVAVEPYRHRHLAELVGDVPVEIIPEPVQRVDLAVFEALGTNDILFIDSSHVARTGSDVMFLVLQVLPRLQPGVLVHIHDIPFPYGVLDPADVLTHHLFWNEWALVLAYLSHNRSYEVLSCSRALHHEAPDVLAEALGAYRSDLAAPPSSLWLRRIAE